MMILVAFSFMTGAKARKKNYTESPRRLRGFVVYKVLTLGKY